MNSSGCSEAVAAAGNPGPPLRTIRPDRIGFDFDGVIADIGETFIRLACREHGYCNLRLADICSFQIEQCLDIDPLVVETIFRDILADSLGTGLRPIPGAIETLTELAERAPVTIITARPEREPVRLWLEHFCPDALLANLRLFATGDHDNKESFIRNQRLCHFIDDRVQTCLHLARAGLKPIVYNQPWNRNLHDLPSVSNWEDIAGLIDLEGTLPP